MQKPTIEDLILIWNEKVKGHHKTVRVKSNYLKDPKFIKLFNSATSEIPSLGDWAMIIEETLLLFDESDFWESRRGKQSLMWLFQRRSGGRGEYNWIYFYELAMDRKENEEIISKAREQVKDEFFSPRKPEEV